MANCESRSAEEPISSSSKSLSIEESTRDVSALSLVSMYWMSDSTVSGSISNEQIKLNRIENRDGAYTLVKAKG